MPAREAWERQPKLRRSEGASLKKSSAPGWKRSHKKGGRSERERGHTGEKKNGEEPKKSATRGEEWAKNPDSPQSRREKGLQSGRPENIFRTKLTPRNA